MKFKKTGRGFARAEFWDRNGVPCVLQKSSIANDNCIWLGCDGPNPRVLAAKLNGGQPDGWKPLPLPDGITLDDIVVNDRMHLTRKQVKALLPHLIKFVETGELK